MKKIKSFTGFLTECESPLVKTVPDMTYSEFGGTLSLTQSINHSTRHFTFWILNMWAHDQTINWYYQCQISCSRPDTTENVVCATAQGRVERRRELRWVWVPSRRALTHDHGVSHASSHALPCNTDTKLDSHTYLVLGPLFSKCTFWLSKNTTLCWYIGYNTAKLLNSRLVLMFK